MASNTSIIDFCSLNRIVEAVNEDYGKKKKRFHLDVFKSECKILRKLFNYRTK